MTLTGIKPSTSNSHKDETVESQPDKLEEDSLHKEDVSEEGVQEDENIVENDSNKPLNWMILSILKATKMRSIISQKYEFLNDGDITITSCDQI